MLPSAAIPETIRPVATPVDHVASTSRAMLLIVPSTPMDFRVFEALPSGSALRYTTLPFARISGYSLLSSAVVRAAGFASLVTRSSLNNCSPALL
ncbi:hypothetical protein D3C75_1119800 [compost metagenome]